MVSPTRRGAVGMEPAEVLGLNGFCPEFRLSGLQIPEDVQVIQRDILMDNPVGPELPHGYLL